MGCFGASREVMANVSPLGPVYQGGTLSGNPLATAAGLAALRQMTDERYEELTAKAERLATGLRQSFASAGVAAQVPQIGPLLGLFFAADAVRNYDDAKDAADTGVFPKFFHGMLDRGYAFAPGAYEAIFPSLAHSDEELDRTIDAAAEVAHTLS